MKTIPFNESARDVEHDASVEVPNDSRRVLVIRGGYEDRGWDITQYYPYGSGWMRGNDVVKWRELPAPPKPAPTIVPHSLEHWHDPKVERPEPGRRFITIMENGYPEWIATGSADWDHVVWWSYYPKPETSR